MPCLALSQRRISGAVRRSAALSTSCDYVAELDAKAVDLQQRLGDLQFVEAGPVCQTLGLSIWPSTLSAPAATPPDLGVRRFNDDIVLQDRNLDTVIIQQQS